MTATTYRSVLFIVFITIFVATAVTTLLGITNVITIRDGYLNTLFSALILEVIGAVIALFKSASFFGGQVSDEAKQIEGYWWELITGKENLSLSFVRIQHSPKTGALTLTGDAYSKEGKPAAEWTSYKAWIDDETLQLIYLWSGNEFQTKTNELSGFGAVRFRTNGAGAVDHGVGWFISPAVPDPGATNRVFVEMRRASESDRTVMLGNDSAAKIALVEKINAAR
jgi:hypothetical protein